MSRLVEDRQAVRNYGGPGVVRGVRRRVMSLVALLGALVAPALRAVGIVVVGRATVVAV